eukprot:gene1944-2985_t
MPSAAHRPGSKAATVTVHKPAARYKPLNTLSIDPSENVFRRTPGAAHCATAYPTGCVRVGPHPTVDLNSPSHPGRFVAVILSHSMDTTIAVINALVPIEGSPASPDLFPLPANVPCLGYSPLPPPSGFDCEVIVIDNGTDSHEIRSLRGKGFTVWRSLEPMPLDHWDRRALDYFGRYYVHRALLFLDDRNMPLPGFLTEAVLPYLYQNERGLAHPPGAPHLDGTCAAYKKDGNVFRAPCSNKTCPVARADVIRPFGTTTTVLDGHNGCDLVIGIPHMVSQ